MASIKERNGSYQISVSLGRDSKGKQIFERITYKPESNTPKKIEKEVRQFADEFEKMVRDGKYLSGEKTTFEKVCELWEGSEDASALTKRAFLDYKSILKNHAIPAIGNMKISKIRVVHLESVYKQLKDAGKAPATIRKIHTAINSVFKYALRTEIIYENVCERVKLPKAGTTLKKKKEDLHYFTLEQAKTFLSALEKEYDIDIQGHSRTLSTTGCDYSVSDYTIKHQIPLQYQVYFNLAIIGGFRRGELVALTWKDIDFENETISINKSASKVAIREGGQFIKGTKTTASVRTIKMPSMCFDLLRKWRNEERKYSLTVGTKWEGYRGKEFDRNYIFIQLETNIGQMMNLDTPYHKFKKIIEMYNATCYNEQDKLPMIRLHDLRHTSATLLISEREDIETISHRLGHSKASVTMDVYGHWMKETDERASNTMGKLFASNQ